ncbi:purine nucleoside permease [Acetobacter cibinongensis]|uniref:Purine nucleoside permease n=2 Tax=Acetobacter cibinongensis TaxID=146475 RepID=A0A0D6MZZ5_9PROT|nr:purine nucleoside permease [Acetobacter cibinongensis]GAN59060.1 purine nucleoside permease [Acetobacter cibinongensis]GBQ19704.1 purine nucleoside transporter [Acetobacter cibinongensis NRIC 0482]GEL58924.1 purine nucleoside permease [Acetobacter cibinongensis]
MFKKIMLGLAFALTGPISSLPAFCATAPTPAANTIEPKVIIVTGWENGADTGDAPGEYQFWVERLHLDQTVPIKGISTQVLRRNADGVYGIVLKDGITDLAALALDTRFDLHHTYWLFTGISGVNPNVASVGSVAWSRWVVDGDALREIDDRSIPHSWPYGLYAIGADKPNTLPNNPNHYGSVTDIADLTKAYPLNRGLEHWAYKLSASVTLADAPAISAQRKNWDGYPNAQKVPFVLEGETLGAYRYWHGARRNTWAEDWVKLWTKGEGLFAMTNEESQLNQAEMRILSQLGHIDLARIMVLRSGSNFSMPPAHADITHSMGDEGPGQVIAFDNNERAGEPVVKELVKNWSHFYNHIPGNPL